MPSLPGRALSYGFQNRILEDTSCQWKWHFLSNSPCPNPNLTSLVSQFLFFVVFLPLGCLVGEWPSKYELGHAKRLRGFREVSLGPDQVHGGERAMETWWEGGPGAAALGPGHKCSTWSNKKQEAKGFQANSLTLAVCSEAAPRHGHKSVSSC